MPEFELDIDEWNELGQWRRLTILHKQPDGRWLLTRDANLLTVQPAAAG